MIAHRDLLPGERLKRVGVVPPSAFHARRRLWSSLEAAFAVSFQARRPDQLAELDAVISHGVEVSQDGASPTLAAHAEEPLGGCAKIALTSRPGLECCLRGQLLGDDRALYLPTVEPRPAEIVLATRSGCPTWTVDRETGSRHRCAALPQELGESEVLRDRLKAGRFFALLPILVLLRALTAQSAWTPPPPRATFMFDDPNLHRSSFGHLDFADLALRAQRDSFHVAFATVPIDAWYADRRAVGLMRSSPLSLLVHGNDHTRCELGVLSDQAAALKLVAQAVRRVQRLERRTGLCVARVMAPPHGQCSPEVFQALRQVGFLAACISRPYPWLQAPSPRGPLTQWGIADVIDGLAVIPRYSITRSREDLPLRMFLGQPLILYGHHSDISHDPDLLGQIAGEINGLGEVQWCDCDAIAKGSFLTRRDGDLLRVRMYTREAEIEAPEGVRQIAVELPAEGDHPSGGSVLLSSGVHSTAGGLNDCLQLADAPGPLRVRLRWRDGVDAARVRAPRWRPWPRIRRVLVESRDRLTPTLDSIRSAGE